MNNKNFREIIIDESKRSAFLNALDTSIKILKQEGYIEQARTYHIAKTKIISKLNEYDIR